MKYKIIDLFAGPGGLGEGFASLDEGKTFEIAVSAEMETSAHKTLTLRSFFRRAKLEGDEKSLGAYYNYCNSSAALHPSEAEPLLWKKAKAEANQLTLGKPEHNLELDRLIEKANLQEDETVLIGGPPCQAYSLVGRSRNMGKTNYVAEGDHRHFLYREYLRILHESKPAIFVMENVKGILSSKVDGRLIFHDILRDLTDPGKALGLKSDQQYNIHSLVSDTHFGPGMEPSSIDPRNFTIHAEEYGIPQARHRVILLGVRSNIPYDGTLNLTPVANRLNVRFALEGVPHLRSKLSKADDPQSWKSIVAGLGQALQAEASERDLPNLAVALKDAVEALPADLSTGSLRHSKAVAHVAGITPYEKWVQDDRMRVWLNHETRSHMDSDLGRYIFAAAFGQMAGYSPKGHTEFSLSGLAPAHANWTTGKFADRFRVQVYDRPSTTVTSHISKDGHYFIHPDPSQCRSLTVREAARLQTFPDNYFFQGNRTQQFHQVGNAVPSLLANQIAEICKTILNSPQKSPCRP